MTVKNVNVKRQLHKQQLVTYKVFGRERNVLNLFNYITGFT